MSSAMRASSAWVRAPAEAERGHEVAQLLAIENHALEDAVHEGVQCVGGEAGHHGSGSPLVRIHSPTASATNGA